MLNHHCNVVAAARSNEPLEKLRSEYPEQVQLLAGDLADFSLGQKAVNLAKSKWGRLDGLIVNHGVLNPVTRIRDVEAEEWRVCFDVNVFSAVAMVYYFNTNEDLKANMMTDKSSPANVEPKPRQNYTDIFRSCSQCLCSLGCLWRFKGRP